MYQQITDNQDKLFEQELSVSEKRGLARISSSRSGIKTKFVPVPAFRGDIQNNLTE